MSIVNVCNWWWRLLLSSQMKNRAKGTQFCGLGCWAMGSVFYHVFHSPDLSQAFTYYVHAISTHQPELSKMWEMQFCTFYSFYSQNFVLHLPHLLQVERYKWAIYQRCMRARWRRRWWKFHQLLKLIKVSDRSETFFQFIIIIIIFINITIIIYVIIRPE